MKQLLVGIFLALLASQQCVMASDQAASIAATDRNELVRIAGVCKIGNASEILSHDLAELIIREYGTNESIVRTLGERRKALEKFAHDCGGVSVMDDNRPVADEQVMQQIVQKYKEIQARVESLQTGQAALNEFKNKIRSAVGVYELAENDVIVRSLEFRLTRLPQFRQRVSDAAGLEPQAGETERTTDSRLAELIQTHRQVRTELERETRALAGIVGEASHGQVLARLHELEQRRIDFEAGVRQELGVKDEIDNAAVLAALKAVRQRETDLAQAIRRIAGVENEASDKDVLAALEEATKREQTLAAEIREIAGAKNKMSDTEVLACPTRKSTLSPLFLVAAGAVFGGIATHVAAKYCG